MTQRCWLTRSDGSRILVDRRGVLIGRALGNDLMVTDLGTSSVHALARIGPRGPEILAFGRNPTRVNGQPVDGVTLLADGDVVALPGERLTVLVEGERISAAPTSWTLTVDGGSSYGLHRSPIIVGGGEDDDVFIPAWPAGALALSLVQGALVMELSATATVSGKRRAKGRLYTARMGDVVAIGGTQATLIGEPWRTTHSTEVVASAALPTEVRFEFMPSGGHLDMRFPRGKVSLRLPEIRARLVATLLTSHGGYQAGEWVPDDVVIPSVWPRQEGKTRSDVNILVHRVRRNLLSAGVNPFALIERLDRATRFCLADSADVEVA